MWEWGLWFTLCVYWEGGSEVNHISGYLHESISTNTTMQPIHWHSLGMRVNGEDYGWSSARVVCIQVWQVGHNTCSSSTLKISALILAFSCPVTPRLSRASLNTATHREEGAGRNCNCQGFVYKGGSFPPRKRDWLYHWLDTASILIS